MGGDVDSEVMAVTKEDFDDAVKASDAEHRGVVWCTSGGNVTSKKYYSPVATDEWKAQGNHMSKLARDLDFFTSSQVTLNLLTGSAYPLFTSIHRAMEDCGASVLPCDTRSSDDYIVKAARRFKANTIVSTTNRLAQLAYFLLAEGITLPVKHIIFFGSFPQSAQAKVFEHVFGTEMHSKLFPPTFAAVYGTSELGILGFSPSQLRDTHLFITSGKVCDFTLKECVKSELPPSSMEGKREVFENQRKYPMVGWKGKLMKKDPQPWTDDQLRAMKRSQVKLPDVEEHGVWGFCGEWKVAPTWSYAWDWAGPWMAEEDLIAAGSPNGGKRDKPKIRRRGWSIRILRTKSPEERGSGRLLVTMLLRKAVPYLKYDTGDVAKPVEGGTISFMGDSHPAIRILCRQHVTFQIGEFPVFLSELDPLLAKFLDSQVVHDYKQDEGGARHVLSVRVVLEPVKGQKPNSARDMPAEEKKRLAMDIREVIGQSRKDKDLPEYHVDVQSVLPQELKVCDNSMKIRRLIDARGLGGVPKLVRKREHRDPSTSLTARSSSGLSQNLQFKPPSVDDGASVAESFYSPSLSHVQSDDEG